MVLLDKQRKLRIRYDLLYTGKNVGTRMAMIEWVYGQTQTPKKAEKITNFSDDNRKIGTLLEVLGK